LRINLEFMCLPSGAAAKIPAIQLWFGCRHVSEEVSFYSPDLTPASRLARGAAGRQFKSLALNGVCYVVERHQAWDLADRPHELANA
jgi:hypothetical protein